MDSERENRVLAYILITYCTDDPDMTAVRHLEFLTIIDKFLMVDRVRRAILRHRVKFCDDQSNRCRDNGDLSTNCKIVAARHSWFIWQRLGPPTKNTWLSLSFCKIGWNRCSSFDNMKVVIFCAFGLKTPIHVRNFREHPHRDPQKAETRHTTYKSLRSFTRFCAAYPLLNPKSYALQSFQYARHAQNCPFTCGDLDTHLINASLGPPEFISQAASRVVQPFCRNNDRDRQTDRSRYSVCSNRPHLASATMRPNNKGSKNFDKRPHRRGFFIGTLWHPTAFDVFGPK